jgi:hypothetical protein
MALDPVSTMNKVYQFIDQEIHPVLRKWVEKSQNVTRHSKGLTKVQQVYSTEKNAKYTISKWRKSLEPRFHLVQKVQEICKNAMKLGKDITILFRTGVFGELSMICPHVGSISRSWESHVGTSSYLRAIETEGYL